MKKSKTLKIFTATAVISSIVAPVASSASFIDVKETNPHYDAIQTLVKRNILNGYEDKTYRPNATLTRGQTAKILANLLQLDTSSKFRKFTDIATSSEYIGAINALAERGVINGYEDGTFKPNAPITRGQMAKIIVNAFGLDKATDINLPFTDVTEKNGYRSYIQTLLNYEITKGSSPSTYAPNEAVKRGQMASFVVRAEQISTQLKKNTTVEGIISNIENLQIDIDGKAYTIPAEMKAILSPSNKRAILGAKVKATVSGDTLVSVQALTITTESSADNPVVLDGSLAKLPSANLTPTQKSNASKFDGVLTVESEYVRLENIEFTNEIVIKKAVKHLTLNDQIEKLTIVEEVEATIAGTAIIYRLVVASNKALNFELNGSINHFEVKTAKANIRLNKILTIIQYILQDGVKIEDIISNYTSNTSPLGGSTTSDSGDALIPNGNNDHQLPGTVTAVKGYISEVTGNTVKIDGKNYTIADSVQALFTSKNKSSLIGSYLTANIEKGKVTVITHLALNNAGTFDGSGLTITGDLLVNADNQSVRNLVVAGNVTISSSIKESVDFNAVDVRGKVSIAESAETARLQRTASLALPVAETVLTHVKITFADSTVALMEIKRADIELGLYGTTRVTTISTESNTSIIANPQVIVPKLSISKGVTYVELNASIASIEVDSNDDIKISGNGNFNSVFVKTDKTVTLNLTATIQQLASDRRNIVLGKAVMVNKTTFTTGELRNAYELIRNYEEVKDNINVDIRDEVLEHHFAAKVIPIEDKYGFVKLSLMNSGDATIKYRLVDVGEEPAQIGEIVPDNTIIYNKDDEFIAWDHNAVEVYKVDSNNIITDVKVIDRWTQSFGHDWMNAFVTNNKLTIETIVNPKIFNWNNQKNTLHNLGLFNGNQQYYFDGFTSKEWEFNSFGIPSITIDFPINFDFDPDGLSILFFEAQNTSGSVYFNNNNHFNHPTEEYNPVFVAGLKSTLQITEPNNIQKRMLDETLSILTREKHYEENGIDFIFSGNYSHLSTLRDAYRKELINATYTTPEEVLTIIKTVNEKNSTLIELYNHLREEIYGLFVKDYDKYPMSQKLVSTVTLEKLENLKFELTSIPDIEETKEYLVSKLNEANFIYNYLNGNLNNSALIVSIENAKKTDVTKLSSTLQKMVNDKIIKAEGELNSLHSTQESIDRTTLELNEVIANLPVGTSSVTLQDISLSVYDYKNTIKLSDIFYKGEVQQGSVVTINGIDYSFLEPVYLLFKLHDLGYEYFKEQNEMGNDINSYIVFKKNEDVTTKDIASVAGGLVENTTFDSVNGFKQLRLNLDAFVPSWAPTEIQIVNGVVRTYSDANELLEELKKIFPNAEIIQGIAGRFFEISDFEINEDDIRVLTTLASTNFSKASHRVDLKLTFSESVLFMNGDVYIDSQSMSNRYGTFFSQTGENELTVSIPFFDEIPFDVTEFMVSLSGVRDLNNHEVVIENILLKR